MSDPQTKSLEDRFRLADEIRRQGMELGFDLVGIAPAEVSRFEAYLRGWLADGQAGTMDYLGRRIDERVDPAVYFPGARSAICVAVNYFVPLDEVPEDQKAHHGRVARYALGDDYHDVLKDRLHALADWIRQRVPGAQTRAAVDTAPVMEKDLAARGGIGWIGKNTCLISPAIGSWLLLGEIITTLELPSDPVESDHCGSCTRCIEACPTQAITAPYQVDARRCISYLTIEHRTPIPENLAPLVGDWLYGCDVCQDVCPHNSKAPAATDGRLQPRFPTGTLDVRSIATWSDDDYRRELKGSAIKRVKLPVLKRNAALAQANLQRGG